MKKILHNCFRVIKTFALAAIVAISGMAQVNAELPVAHSSRNWVNAHISQQTDQFMQIDARTPSGNNSILEWQSFNISQNNRVEFLQPSSSHIALNRIYQNDPSRIMGTLDANGRIYLINQNGILFGSGSQVNVNTLVASSLALNIADDDFINNNINLLNVIDSGVNNGAAFVNGAGAGIIEIESGANINAAEGGSVLVIAPEIINGGDITTNGGQVILAASQDSVYLTPSNDPSLRGFLVELGGTGGHVENAGRVLAERGNITLAGLAINQSGLLQATTSINENGSIRLLARDSAVSASVASDNDELILGIDTDQTDASGDSTKRTDYRVATRGGEVVLGANSEIEIKPVASDLVLNNEDELVERTTTDNQVQRLSRVEITGHDITMQSDASITATGGEVLLHANSNPQVTALNSTGDLNPLRNGDTSLIVLEEGSRIDVSGTTETQVGMERNQLEVQLTGDFLRDAPLQRNGALRGELVNVDIREGTPLGDISAEVDASIKRDITERLSTGGSVELISQGGVVMQQGSEVDIAGGAVHYDAGYINTSRLVTAQGQVVDIADARSDLIYGGLFGKLTIKSERWGKDGERSWSLFGGGRSGFSRYHEAYIDGQDAGSFTIQAPAIDGMATVVAGSAISPLSRTTDERVSGGSLNIITAGQRIDVVTDAASPMLENMLDWLQQSSNTPPDFSLKIDESVFNSGLTNLSIEGSSALLIQSDAQIQMAAGSTLNIESGYTDIQGSIDITAGHVSINSTGSVDINNRIDVSGSWVNDSPELGSDLTTAVDVNAGSITIKGSNIYLTEDSALLANGGGWLQANGKLQTGEGGDISLAVKGTTAGAISELDMAGRVEAFGVNTARGGSLAITANRIRIAPENIQSEAGLMQFTPDFFTENGFADYTLISNMGELFVATGSHIAPYSKNLLLNENAAFHRTGDDINSFSRVVELPAYIREATNLTLASNQSALQNEIPLADSALTIEQGASITTDAGASVSLASASRMFIYGDITAHGGDIDLALNGYAAQTSVIADQAIWVDGKLDVSGVFVAEPVDDSGLRRGRMFDAGNISMTANDGFVITSANSILDVSGVADVMDLPDRAAGNVILSWSHQPVYGNAGSINISAAEGFSLGGEMLATTASDMSSAGSLSLKLDVSGRKNTDTSTYLDSQNARQIHLVQSETSLPNGLMPGDNLPLSGSGNMIGQGWVAADSIEQAGFDNLLLSANNISTSGAAGNGIINVHDDLSLSLRQSLLLNAPILRGNGNANLNAAYVYLGNRDLLTSPHDSVSASGGNGHLQINASGLLDVASVRLQGFDEVVLHSDGDIRARGLDDRSPGEFDLKGSLQAGHNLTLSADQIYATTFSKFDFTAANILNIEAAGDHTPVLSAGSVLSFNADTIHHGGVVKAPLGELHFNAGSLLDIQAGSLSSVSAEGQVIPFGTILGQERWVYGNDYVSGYTRPNYLDAPPDKRISLNSDGISIADDAVFDISGGGDLYAWEFVKGLGGSNDNLLPEYNNGAFAVLPGFSEYAPYDSIWWNNVNNINMGDQVYLGGSEQLAAGVYTKLPARYALLPGAVLVTPAGNSMLPGQMLYQVDGAAVVAGQQRVANTDIGDQLWSGYVIEDGAIVRSHSEYFETTASQFFRDVATHNDTELPAMPEDAGALDIVAQSSLSLAGTLLGNAATVNYLDETGLTQSATGRSSQVNIAGDNLRVVNTLDTNGGIQLLGDALNDFGAASLLLGGTRTRTAEGTVLNVTADTVTIESDVSLNIPSLMLVARDHVTVASRASIDATGDAGKQDDVLLVDGDGALLRASSAAQVSIQRSNENGTRGELDVELGATITADASMLLDASLNSTVDGELRMQGGSLNLGSSRISLGEVTGTPGGLVLDSTRLNQLIVDELVLTSRSSVDFYGDLDLTFDGLAIEAAAIDGYQQVNENLLLQVGNLRLGNPASASNNVAPTGSGHLTVHADNIELDDGDLALRGFGDVSLLSSTNIVLTGSGSLNMSASNVTLGGRITASQRRADYIINAGNELVTTYTGSATEPRNEVLAASLTLNADQILHQGVIDLVSGNVNMHASLGNVVLQDGSVINLSGIARDFAGDMRYSSGGHVELVSDHGSITQQATAEINVSGGDDLGAAGGLKLIATEGNIDLSGSVLAAHHSSVDGGRFVVDARTITNFSALNQQLNTNGFDQQRHMRLRQGDIALAANETITAHDVTLMADAGNVTINGSIDASGNEGGEVVLAAQNDVRLASGAYINASAIANDERGGRVFIETREGMLDLASGAGINVSGTNSGGEIFLRAPRTPGNNDINITSVAADMQGFERIDVEGYRTYDMGTDSLLSITDLTTRFNEASSFMANNILGGLDFSVALDDVHLRPGIELYRDGDLSVSGNLDFFSRRYSNNGHSEAGIFSVRAGGNLNINGSISDGFAWDPNGLEYYRLQTGESWSYRLVAGADLNAAHGMTAANSGSDITVAADQYIRTGTGDIEIAAADDLVLLQSAAIYTAGESTGYGGMAFDLGGPTFMDYVMPRVEFPDHGGDVTITVGGDVTAMNDSYLLTDWLHRVGNPADPEPNFNGTLGTAWGVEFGYFRNGIGVLGGGDLRLFSGGSVKDITLAAPTTGKQIGNFEVILNEYGELLSYGLLDNAEGLPDNRVTVAGQGDIRVQAAGDVERSLLYVGNGKMDLHAGGDIGNSMNDSGVFLVMENTRANIFASGDIHLQGVSNPHLMPLSVNQDANLGMFGLSVANYYSWFSTYDAASHLSLQSLGGDLVLRNKLESLHWMDVVDDVANAGNGANPGAAAGKANFYPGSLTGLAFDGDLLLGGTGMALSSSHQGELSLLANGDFSTSETASVVMLDQPLSNIPDMLNPLVGDFSLLNTNVLLNGNAHAAQALHQFDFQPARIVARTGDITPNSENNVLNFYIPKAVEMIAGRDILGVSLYGQNLHDSDISLIEAGRDFRHINGTLYTSPPSNEIRIGGPGELHVIAGRDIDLADRNGIISYGNNVNPALPDSGADVLVMAGAASANYDAFINRYFTADSDYSENVIAFMNQHGFSFAGNEFDAALVAFVNLDTKQQRSLVLQSFFNEITESASRAAAEQNNLLDKEDVDRFGYSRGLDAIATLFPASVVEQREALEGEFTSGNVIVTGGYTYTLDEHAIQGDVSLISSTITTEDDDSHLSVLTPGGMLNVGLTVDTGSSGLDRGLIAKGNGDINIYTLGDVAVNQSRIQALNGGDMSIWSSLGDIDAGRGAKSALGVPKPVLILDIQHNRIYQEFAAVVQGSGIRSDCFDEGCKAGNIVLAAPAGVIDAGDAGINAAGNLTLATDTVLNANNIEAAGDSTGVPTDAAALGIDLGGMDVNSSGADVAENTSLVAQDASDQFGPGSVAIISVEVLGLGDE